MKRSKLERGLGADSAGRKSTAGLNWSVYQTPAFIYLGELDESTIDPDGLVRNPESGAAFKLVGSGREAGRRNPTTSSTSAMTSTG
jgi:hypothetical protein